LRPVRSSALALAVLALVFAGAGSAASPLDRGGAYLLSRQQADGGFAEPGRSSTPGLTAWAVLALKAGGRLPSRAEQAADYLAGAPAPEVTDVELRLLALAALGENVSELADRIERLRRPNGRIGPAVNSTVWGAIALRSAGRSPGSATARFLLSAQRRNGGWPWSAGAAADTDDTAAAIEALRAAGVLARSPAIKRGLRYLRSCQNRDGGFAYHSGAGSTAQSTAWAIQAFLAAGVEPGKPAFRFLARLEQPDGSYRHSARYRVTPVWVTAQVLPALARKPFPLLAES
jgi:iron complex transport system substrate-binding protein